MSIFEGLSLSGIEPEDLVVLRHQRERDISQAIHDINLINVELNGRLGHIALPEFGSPITSHEQLTIDHVTEEPDDVA